MARVAIVTDSTSDLPSPLRERHAITVVPLSVHLGGEVLRDQIELTTDQFLARLGQTADLPATSQPPPAVFEETFRRLATDHDAVVAVVLSAKLSGTFHSATLAAAAVREVIPVEVVDSRSGSMGLGLQALRAAELAATGQPAPATVARLRAETVANHVLFFVDTLEYLRRGGRIGRAAALIGGSCS
jgi:DegV family protein with EDD domain